MSRYEKHTYVPGATPEERVIILKSSRRIDIVRAVSVVRFFGDKEIVSRYLYDNFMKGGTVPEFVRKRITQYLCEKSQEYEKMAKALKGKSKAP